MEDPPIWKRLDDERAARGMTRADWARFLGVTPAAYNNWRTREVPTTSYAQVMAKTRWSYERLVKGLANSAKSPPEDSQLLELAERYARLSSSGKAMLLSLSKAVESSSGLEQDKETLPASPRGWIAAEDENDGIGAETSKPPSRRGIRRVA